MHTVDQAVEAFLDHRRLRPVSRRTLETYRYWFSLWQNWRREHGYAPELAAVRIEELRGFLTYLHYEHVPHSRNPRRPAAQRRGMSDSALRSAWSLLRSLWIFLANDEQLSAEQQRYFVGDRIPRPEVYEDVRPFCDEPTLDQLLAACSEMDEGGLRNRAILLILFQSGVRVAELASLTDEIVDLEQRRAWIMGKGRKGRWVFWGSQAALALQRYLHVRRGPPGGPLFRGTSVRNNGGGMTDDAIRGMMKRLANQAGVTLPPHAPVHWLRHGFAHKSLDAGLDVSQVSQLLGHANVETTMRYVREYPLRLQMLHAQVFDQQPTVARNRRTIEHGQ